MDSSNPNSQLDDATWHLMTSSKTMPPSYPLLFDCLIILMILGESDVPIE